jgi:hypothetical protein
MPLVQSRLDQCVTPVLATSDGKSIRPGEVLLLETPERSEVRRMLEARGATRLGAPGSDGGWRRDFPSAYRRLDDRSPESAGPELWTGLKPREPEELVHHRGVHYNRVYFGAGVYDFYHGGPGGRPAVASPLKPFSVSTEGPRVTIAVLDTGLPAEWKKHPSELTNVTPKNSVLNSEDRLIGMTPSTPARMAGHGMFICGLIRRTEPNVDIEMYRVLEPTGEGDEWTIINTLAHVGESSTGVVSLSFGGFSDDDTEPPLAEAIHKLLAAGKVVVAAAGNAGGWQEYRGRTMFPASMREVVATGAYDSRRGGRRRWRRGNPSTIYAAGLDMVSVYFDWDAKKQVHVPTADAWARWSGSSFATPVVAARIAVELLQSRPASVTAMAVVNTWRATLPVTTWPNKAVWPCASALSDSAVRFDNKVDLTT